MVSVAMLAFTRRGGHDIKLVHGGKMARKRKNLLRKLSLYPADIFLQNLAVPDLLLHVPCLLRIPSEHQQTRSQSVQSVNRPQVFQIVLFSQYEYHSIMTIATTWMDLKASKTLREQTFSPTHSMHKNIKIIQRNFKLRNTPLITCI